MLDAEREAQKLIEDARKCMPLSSPWRTKYLTVLFTDRLQRVKDAEKEANKEIEEYKSVMEADFAKFSRSVCGAPLLGLCSLITSVYRGKARRRTLRHKSTKTPRRSLRRLPGRTTRRLMRS